MSQTNEAIQAQVITEHVVVGQGGVVGLGGTNFRTATFKDGDVYGFKKNRTPNTEAEFFAAMARMALESADDGAEWMLAGYPGPVSADGRRVGPMTNVSGLQKKEYDIVEEVSKADPAAARLIESGFFIFNTNDGPLAAQAVAARLAHPRHNRIAAMIIGTGQGAGIVDRDMKFTSIWRTDEKSLAETGHPPLDPFNPKITFENLISGTAIKERSGGISAEDLPKGHALWTDVGYRSGQLATFLALFNGAELVVPTGGVGAGSSDKFRDHMEAMLDNVRQNGNAVQAKFLPDVAYIPPADADVFEMFGAGGIMADIQTR